MSDIISFEELIKELEKIIDNEESRIRIMNLATEALKADVEIYPPEGAWNRPPGTNNDNRWYERGYGSRWLRNDGTMGGKFTSEKLNESWRRRTEEHGQKGIVYSEVSYAPFLYDAERRVSWAAAHGWKTQEQTLEEFSEKMEDIITKEIYRVLDL